MEISITKQTKNMSKWEILLLRYEGYYDILQFLPSNSVLKKKNVKLDMTKNEIEKVIHNKIFIIVKY